MWPTCDSSVTRRDVSQNAQNTTLYTNCIPNPIPNNAAPAPAYTHIYLYELCLEKNILLFMGRFDEKANDKLLPDFVSLS